MKTLKFITTAMLLFIFTFTSCQDELDVEQGDNPNANTPESVTASNLRRSAMYDGSSDDFLDGNSCSSVILPVTANVNGQQVTIINESDYQLVLNILGELNNDDDVVSFQFPISVRLSNYTETVINSQSEFDALIAACAQAEAAGQDAISCVDINYPITILTYSVNFDQTGSAVIQSDQQLYTFMENLGDDELFAVDYPITVDSEASGIVTVTSDLDLQAKINQCLEQEELEEEAENSAQDVIDILVDGVFTVESFLNDGTQLANDYLDFTIEFSNDMTVVAKNGVSSAIQDVQGTYEVYSETDVFLEMNFQNNAVIELLNGTWEVVSYTESSISLQSTTDSTITLDIAKI